MLICVCLSCSTVARVAPRRRVGRRHARRDRPCVASPCPAYDRAALVPPHRPHRRRRVPPRPPRPVHRRARRRRRRLGHRRARPAPGDAAWPPRSAPRTTSTRSSSADRRPPTVRVVGSIVDYMLTAGRPDDHRRPARRPAGRDRLADDHRSRIRRDPSSTTPTFDVIAAALDDDATPATRRSRSSAATTCPATATPPAGATLAAASTPGRRAGGDWIEHHVHVPELDGRPHHAGDGRGRPRVAARRARHRRPLAGRRRAVPPVGRGGRASPPAGRVGDVGVLVHRPRPRLGAVQAAAAQRRPLGIATCPRSPASRSSTRRWPLPEVRRLPRDAAPTSKPCPSLDEIPGHPPRATTSPTVLERFANTGRPRPDRPDLHRRQRRSSRRSWSRRSSTSSATAGRSRVRATALAGWARYLGTVPVADQSPSTPAADVARGATPPRRARPGSASSSSTPCSTAVAARAAARFRAAFVSGVASGSPTNGPLGLATGDARPVQNLSHDGYRIGGAAPSSSITASGRSTCSP